MELMAALLDITDIKPPLQKALADQAGLKGPCWGEYRGNLPG